MGPFLVATVINYFYPKQSVVAARYIAAVATLTILVAVVLSCLAYAPTAIITSAQIGLAALMPLLGCLLGKQLRKKIIVFQMKFRIFLGPTAEFHHCKKSWTYTPRLFHNRN